MIFLSFFILHLYLLLVSATQHVQRYSRFSQHRPSLSSRDATLNSIFSNRISIIIGGLGSASDVESWVSSLNTTTGQWKDVDYSTGCTAERATWPAEQHWARITAMAGAWHGGLQDGSALVNFPSVKNAIDIAMEWWFAHDFFTIHGNDSCMTSGGTDPCPCNPADTSMWNTNWFSSVLGSPVYIAQTCLLLGSNNLSPSQLGNCTHMTSRAYQKFVTGIPGVSISGANLLDLAKIGIDLGLFTSNTSMISDAYARIHSVLQINDTVEGDGVFSDGTFGQHSGLLYNGNYGKDFANDILTLELAASGTDFSADSGSRHAFASLIDADRWMIYQNTKTGVLHWDLSVIGRFVSLSVMDSTVASANIHINVTQVSALGEAWDSSVLKDFASSLSSKSDSANAGNLVGNRMFYAHDYMVHRGSNYITSVKMFSTRTRNAECLNSQNLQGFHLSDGAVYTYMAGDEYEDIGAAQDWNLIPGITVGYGATALVCDNINFQGVENFVGGVSNGESGIAVMRYTNPATKSLKFQKTWFFLKDDVQHVMISNIASKTSSPVLSVLDQKHRNGDILVDGQQSSGKTYPGAKALWHDGVGYVFDPSNPVTLTIETGPKASNWSAIGTSKAPNTTVDLFAAYLKHESLNASVSYTAFPGTTQDSFATKQQDLSKMLNTMQNDGHVSAIHDVQHKAYYVVFWDDAGGSVRLGVTGGQGVITMVSNAGAAVIFEYETGNLTVSDPSQIKSSIAVDLRFTVGVALEKTITYDFSNVARGSSITQNVRNR